MKAWWRMMLLLLLPSSQHFTDNAESHSHLVNFVVGTDTSTRLQRQTLLKTQQLVSMPRAALSISESSPASKPFW